MLENSFLNYCFYADFSRFDTLSSPISEAIALLLAKRDHLSYLGEAQMTSPLSEKSPEQVSPCLKSWRLVRSFVHFLIFASH